LAPISRSARRQRLVPRLALLAVAVAGGNYLPSLLASSPLEARNVNAEDSSNPPPLAFDIDENPNIGDLQRDTSPAARYAAMEAADVARSDYKVIVAQHSQANEKEADDYALNFLKTKGYQPMGAVSALDKLAAMSAGHRDSAPWLSTHPAPDVRAKRMRKQLGIAA
jgi:hypothetical protein